MNLPTENEQKHKLLTGNAECIILYMFCFVKQNALWGNTEVTAWPLKFESKLQSNAVPQAFAYLFSELLIVHSL